jgi:copper transport protein
MPVSTRLSWNAALAGVALAFWLGLCSYAAAHASLNATEPRDGTVVASAPAQYTLTFSEPVAPIQLRLIGPDGASEELDRFAVRGNSVLIEAPGELGEGTHVLTWRVVSADGHPVGGSVLFSIGQPSATPPVVEQSVDPQVAAGLWASKLALYGGLFLGAGGAFGLAWLLPLSRAGSSFVRIALAVGFAGALLSLGFQGVDTLGASVGRYFDPLAWSSGFATSYGQTVVAAIAAFFLAAVSTVLKRTALSRALSLAAVAAGAAGLALSGHASSAEPQWLMRPAVFVHAAAIAVWCGALVPLGIALASRRPDATVALRRFSTIIPYSVAALIAAGMALTFVQVQQPAALVETAYGRLLLAKFGLLIVVFALAAFNRWSLTGRVARGDGDAGRRLVRMIAAETLVVLVIFGVAAGWRFTPPPRALAEAAAQPAALHIHTSEAMADLTVTPGRAGAVEVSAILMTGDFGPLDAREVTFVFSNDEAGIEPFERRAEKPGDGSWRAAGVVLPLAGRWTVRVDILIDDFTLVRIAGDIDIRP